jgi:hypothetical protein
MNDHETREAAVDIMRIALHLLTILEKCLPDEGDGVKNATTRMAVVGMMVHVLITTMPKGNTRDGAMRHAEAFGKILLGGMEKHYEENDDATSRS